METTLDFKAMGRRVAHYRHLMGLTQQELAEMVGVSTQHISGIERGVASPSISSFFLLCCALCVYPNDLMAFHPQSDPLPAFPIPRTLKSPSHSVADQWLSFCFVLSGMSDYDAFAALPLSHLPQPCLDALIAK